MPAELVIDCGVGYTKAVLVRPDAGSTVLGFDGGPALSSAVHVAGGTVSVGAAAWRKAEAEPEGFVFAPLRAGTGVVSVGGADVEVADLVAAPLRHVMAEAQRVAGERVEGVRLIVPATWGPRSRTWLRHVAGRAGLGQPRLVEAPAAAVNLLASDPDRSAWSVCLLVDVGAGCEVSVLRRDAAGAVEVLSTLADADLGGDRIDAALAEIVTGMNVDELPPEQRWQIVASTRTAKQALAEQVAVTMPLPGDAPAVVVNGAFARQAAQPILERVGDLAVEAVSNADLTLADVDVAYGVGATMTMPGTSEMVAAKLGIALLVPEQPGLAAVLGAAGTGPLRPADGAGEAARPIRVPPLRRLAGLLLPGVASLLLYGHFVFAAEFNNGTPTLRREHYYVLAAWGELAVAALLALLTCLQASALLAALTGRTAAGARPDLRAETRISTGIGRAVAVGVAVAGLYAVAAAVYFAQPVAGPLRWALLPILPTVVCATALCVIAWRRREPRGGWDTFLVFPAAATIAAAIGIFAITAWWHGHLPAWTIGWEDPLGYLGGVLIGVAIAATVVQHPVGRIALSLPLGFFCLIISRSGPGIPAVLFAIAVAAWWAHRAWTLARTPGAAHAP